MREVKVGVGVGLWWCQWRRDGVGTAVGVEVSARGACDGGDEGCYFYE